MAELNWSENVEYSAEELHHPESIEELQERIAAATGVKALGTRHSFNRVADTGGTLITTTNIDLDVVIDHATMTATVPGSWTYAQVASSLEAEGVALHNMGSLPHISLAGGTATGTHGSGDTNKILAAAISGVDIITADGSLRRIDRTMPELGAVAVGLGAFGVITQLTLDVEPSYLVRQDLYQGASWDTVLVNLDEIMASAYSVNLHADFSSPDTRSIWQKSIVDSTTIAEVERERWGALRLDAAELDPGRVTPLLPPGPWSQRLPHFVPEGAPSVGGDELQTEYFVDRTHAVAAIEVLRGMGEQIDPHLHGTEIRTVAADDLWLSPATGRDCLSIGFTWKKHVNEVLSLLAPIEAALAPFEPTPHWGKLFAMRRPELASRFSRLDDFLALAAEWDPSSKFENSFLRKLAA